MDLYPSATLEAVASSLLGSRPITHGKIDFKNPYFTQPKRKQEADKQVALETLLQGASIEHLYIHVPFCLARCHYCHYPKAISDPREGDRDWLFLEQLRQEIAYYQELVDFSALKTVHVGGGTPNALSQHVLGELLDEVNACFRYSEELAVELYPSEPLLNRSTLHAMAERGVNRVSIGIQTFDDTVNLLNNRLEQPAEYAATMLAESCAVFENVSVDLLYGQKGQRLEHLERDLARAAELGVDSIYLYQTRELVKSKGTELQQALNLFLAHTSRLGYEIVSFDQAIRKRNSDGFCLHRSGRSKSESLLGLGPGAVSEIDQVIFRNVDPEHYGNAGGFNADLTTLVEKSQLTLKKEYLNRALRHFNRADVNGLYKPDYKARFATNVVDDLRNELDVLLAHGLINEQEDRIEITDLGMLFTQHINYFLLEHYK